MQAKLPFSPSVHLNRGPPLQATPFAWRGLDVWQNLPDQLLRMGCGGMVEGRVLS